MAEIIVPGMDPRNERRVGNTEGLARRVGELERRLGRYQQGGDKFNQALSFTGGNWANYGAPFPNGMYSRYGRLVVVSGLVNRSPAGPGGGDLIGTLPTGFRPPWQMIFNQYCVTGACRIDVQTDGKLLWVAGNNAGVGWVSLNGIQFLL